MASNGAPTFYIAGIICISLSALAFRYQGPLFYTSDGSDYSGHVGWGLCLLGVVLVVTYFLGRK